MTDVDKPSGRQNQLLVLGKISSILEAFSLRAPERTLADIRESTGLPTSTVQRLVANLVDQGFLEKDEDHYRIGMRLAFWAAPATAGRSEHDVVAPVLKELRDLTGESAVLFRREGRNRVCVGLAETRHALRRELHVGKIMPLHVGSASRVLLAWDPEAVEELLDETLAPITEATITEPEQLRRVVSQTRADGFAITIGERESGASGLSAPVFDARARITSAVSINGPVFRMPREICEGWVEPLVDAAERITRLLGGRYPGEASEY
ncbi:IclR family transcriptional regulator [Brevibacterium aurantiacum]|uniref:IclR family transcriptional regulator n=1 Tax=Brevibacterium aurantiacum TaxID=273384 RepID=UPI000C76B712|nr:IclR family transcriptional regulator [Brevibacterium aurantiacum]